MTGRGSWNNAGVGGTKRYKDSDRPGPYYYIGTGYGADLKNPNDYAVRAAVRVYQDSLNKRMRVKLLVDGLFGDATSRVVTDYQKAHEDECGTPWGGIGPETSRSLLSVSARNAVRLYPQRNQLITSQMVTGTVQHESKWDAGAVGYIDDSDLGLAQINGRAHPNFSVNDRLDPWTAYNFIIAYYDNALNSLHNNVRDAVASYNLGIGGARTWIAAGRPSTWTPEGSTTPRDVKGYIDSILAG